MFELRTPEELHFGEIVTTDSITVLLTGSPKQTYHAGGRTYAIDGVIIDSPWTAGIGALGSRWTIQGNDLRKVAVQVYGPRPC